MAAAMTPAQQAMYTSLIGMPATQPATPPPDPYAGVNASLDAAQTKLNPLIQQAQTNASLVDKAYQASQQPQGQMGAGPSSGQRMYNVRDNRTGQVFQVPESQVNAYGGYNAGTFLSGAVGQAQNEALQPTLTTADIQGKKTANVQADYDYNKSIATQNASTDAQSGMTLKDLKNKYGGYYKKADLVDLLSAYDSNSPNGPHKEQLGQLTDMGFPDSVEEDKKQNTISGINTVRKFQQKWQKVVDDTINNPKNLPADVRDYNAYKAAFSGGITRGIDGRTATSMINAYKDVFSDPTNPSSWLGADGAFKGIEDYVLDSSGGYDYKMLNLPSYQDVNLPKNKQQAGGAGGGATLPPISGGGGGGTQTSAAMEKTGLYNLPVIGGIARAAISPETQLLDDATKKAQEVATLAKTNPQAAQKLAQQYAGTGNAFIDLISGKGFAREALPAALNISSAAELPGIVSGVKTLANSATGGILPKIASGAGKVGQYLTTSEGKVAGQIEQAAAKGGAFNWENAVNGARDIIANKGIPAKKALEDLLVEEAPASTASPRTITSAQALGTRQGLGAQLPGNFFENVLSKAMSGGKSVPRNAALNALRTSVSTELKRVAPDISSPDAMYSLIKKMGGDAPTWAKRIIVGSVAKYAGDKLNIKGAGADLLEGLLGVGAGMI